MDDAAFELYRPSQRLRELRNVLVKFVRDRCIPAERVFEAQHAGQADRWAIPSIMEELKMEAKSLGLWNLFLPADYPGGPGLSLEEYAPLCEIMGWSPLASEACNCSAPDTGNMEVLIKYGTTEQKARWLEPLLRGEIRSAFLMTEPDVASSDATNIRTSIERRGDEYVITGKKWWSTGAMDPRCGVAIVMGRTSDTAAPHKQQSMVLVDMRAPGVQIVRPLTVFGYDDAPFGHAEVHLHGVRVPASQLLLGEGRGFEIAQGRLGPGRVHHCMRALGLGERAMDTMVAVPHAVLQVLDLAIQVHGGAGVSSDTWLARAWAGMRTLRIADGPDEVHLLTVAKEEVKQWKQKLDASEHVNVSSVSTPKLAQSRL